MTKTISVGNELFKELTILKNNLPRASYGDLISELIKENKHLKNKVQILEEERP